MSCVFHFGIESKLAAAQAADIRIVSGHPPGMARYRASETRAGFNGQRALFCVPQLIIFCGGIGC
jgi:hypothetical protein